MCTCSYQLSVLVSVTGHDLLAAHGSGQQCGGVDRQGALCFTSPGEELLYQPLLLQKQGRQNTCQLNGYRWIYNQLYLLLKDCTGL